MNQEETLRSALPEKYRKFASVREGYEIRYADGTWSEVTSKWHVTAPLNFVRLETADGKATVGDPRDEIMSRRTGEPA
jgi:hypothetical protein